MISEEKLRNFVLLSALGTVLDENDIDLDTELGEERLAKLTDLTDAIPEPDEEQVAAALALAKRMVLELVDHMIESSRTGGEENGEAGAECL